MKVKYAPLLSEPEVTSYTVKYSPHTQEQLTNNTNYVLSGPCAFIGYINDIKDNFVKIGFESGANNDQIISIQSAKILIYDPKHGKGFTEGVLGDILTYNTAGNNCDKVLVYMVDSNLRNFIIYRQ